MANYKGDAVIFGECRLKNLRSWDVKRNGEVIGQRTVLDVVTWGGSYMADVDPAYAETLSFGVTGRAVVLAEFDADKEIKQYKNDPARNVDLYKFFGLRLDSFEPSK